MLTIDARPTTLQDLAGLDRLILEMSRYFPVGKPCTFPQVSIFEGASGTGKTSLAYILAPMLSDPDCILWSEDGYPYPDLASASAKHVFGEKFGRSVRFYDASSMGKDDIHQIEDSLGSNPLYDLATVVIIDEAQELTKAGKGSILKLLEKKRDQTYLILCTMNIDSFDRAVKSRAQVFSFKKPSVKVLSEHLFNLLEHHQIPGIPDVFLDQGLFTIAEAADGSVRQAVQYLERCVNAQLWIEEHIIEELGVVASAKSLAEVLGRLLACDATVLEEVVKVDPKELVSRLSYQLADALVWELTGLCKQDWMEAQYVKYRATGRVPQLLETVNKLCGLPYLREVIVKSELAMFMWNTRQSNYLEKKFMEKKPEPQPIMRAAREPAPPVIEQKPLPLESYPWLGYCETCGEKQYQSPSGAVCKGRHGGAGTLSQAELDAIMKDDTPESIPEVTAVSKATRRVI
jgi:DNA polymerase III gamma/tau subunit